MRRLLIIAVCLVAGVVMAAAMVDIGDGAAHEMAAQAADSNQ